MNARSKKKTLEANNLKGSKAKPSRVDFTNRDPTAALYAGRECLGYLHDHGDDGRCAAVSADHQMIGDFAGREEACRALTARHGLN
jgi:hypothetical protein